MVSPGAFTRGDRCIEIETVRHEFELQGRRKPSVRYYWRHVGFEVGASKGKSTEYVYVNYAQEGGVHGFPINLDELRKKGVKP